MNRDGNWKRRDGNSNAVSGIEVMSLEEITEARF